MKEGLEQVRALMRQGRWAEAQAACRGQEGVEAQFLLGVIHGQLGEHEAARQSFQRVVDINPDLPQAQHNLGLALDKLQRHAEAVAAFEQAIRLKPDFVEAYSSLAAVLSSVGQYDQAMVALKRALAVQADNAGLRARLGVLHLKLKHFAEAESCLRQALQQRPDDAALLYNLAQALRGGHRHDQARELVESLLKEYPQEADLYHLMGNVLNDAGQVHEAIGWFDKALALQPDYAVACFDRGVSCQNIGKLDDAIESYRQAIRIDPYYIEAWRAISTVKKFTDPEDPDLGEIEKLAIHPAISRDDRMRLHFSLAKIHEDLKNYEQAFFYCHKANVAKRSSYDFSMDQERSRYELITGSLTKQFIEQRQGFGLHDDQVPIFIVGMPRSGTSLTEQILASHPEVYGAGELSALPDVMKNIAGINNVADLVQTMEQLGAEDFKRFAGHYQEKARRNCQGQRFVTDKMPGNFLFIGFIYLMLPHARVIHCLRDPVDTCYSCYKRLFGTDIKYAYDLTELGQAYCLHHDYMRYWHELLPGFIYDLRYEDLIADQEGQTRRLLEFCGLPWDERCLTFYETERTVATSSFAQVRKPIYQSSVKSWKNFEPYLGPLIAELRQCETGYDI